jgi:hypothetical protein
MKITAIFGGILIIMLSLSNVHAGVFYWINDDGVKHFTNKSVPNNPNARFLFEEYPYDQKADQKRRQSDQEFLNTFIEEMEAQSRQAQAERERRLAEEEANKPPTREELIEEETIRLTNRINELREMPLEFFGSQRNKIRRLGFYHNRLNALERDPDDYFQNPVTFQGNVKYPGQ